MFVLPSGVELMSRKEWSGYKWHFPTRPHSCAFAFWTAQTFFNLQECCWFLQANGQILKKFTSKLVLYTHDRKIPFLLRLSMFIYQSLHKYKFPKFLHKIPSSVSLSIHSWTSNNEWQKKKKGRGVKDREKLTAEEWNFSVCTETIQYEGK